MRYARLWAGLAFVFQTLRCMRAIGDTVFAAGIVAIAIFVLRQRIGREPVEIDPEIPPPAPRSRRLLKSEDEVEDPALVN